LRRVAIVGLLAAFGCGGATPQTHDLPPQPSATASAMPEAPDAGPSSVVRFDDLGVSFAVPPGFHVMGDDELSARIRASANPHLQGELVKRASEKKGIPLLVLSRESGGLNSTLSVVVVPADATAPELMTHQQTVMSENLGSFETTSAPKAIIIDGVHGTTMSTRYDDHGKKVDSQVRLFVRNGLATLAVAVWPDAPNGQGAEDAARLLDGLHFY
jgi:hypothetical protein